jgi:hypothetical protein
LGRLNLGESGSNVFNTRKNSAVVLIFSLLMVCIKLLCDRRMDAKQIIHWRLLASGGA